MVAGTSHRKFFAALAVLGLALVLASTALAVTPPVTLDMRNGATNVVAVTDPNAVVSGEFWAVVTGANGTSSDDRINNFMASIYSTSSLSGGIINGNLTFAFSDAFNSSVLYDDTFSYPGTSQDLNGDGNKDVGSTNNVDVLSGWIYPNAVLTGPVASSLLVPPGFDIGTATFTGTSWVAGSHGVTQLYVVSSTNPNGTGYKVDSVGGSIPATTGTEVTLYRPATAVVGPALTIGVGDPTKILGGTGSTGTFDTSNYKWYINGILTDLTGDTPTVTLDYLVNGLGLGVGTWGVELDLSSIYQPGGITPGEGSIQILSTPEPATLALLAFGGLAMISRRRRSA